MSFPVLTTGILNSIIFGAYSNGLDYLSQSQRSECKPASDAHVFTAGCFSGVMQVSSPEAVTVPDYAFMLSEQRIPQFLLIFLQKRLTCAHLFCLLENIWIIRYQNNAILCILCSKFKYKNKILYR